MKAVWALPALLMACGFAHAQFGDPADDGRAMRFDDVVKRMEARFEPATARRGETVTWTLTVELIPGWHTYPVHQPDPKADSQVTKIKFPKTGDLTAIGPLTEPPDPHKKAEPALGIKEILSYEGTVVWKQTMQLGVDAKPGTKTINIPVTLFACKESCLPPERKDIAATLTISDEPAVPIKSGTPAPNGVKPANAEPREAPTPVAAETVGSSDYEAVLNQILERITKVKVEPHAGLGSFLLTAAFWGMVTLFTPCVFPMIPITVSFFLKQAEKNQGNALFLACVYCGTIIVVLGIAALTLLQFFTILSINPWMNVFLGALFVVLAMSLFGMFDFTLQLGLRAAILAAPLFAVLVWKPAGPQALWIIGSVAVSIVMLLLLNQYIERAAFQLQQSTANRSSVGGILGTIFMAISFTIVSFTCVAPFLGGFGGMASSGQFRTWELMLGALAFSGTFAAPFFFLALFPSMLKKLPKSGGWLNTVKVVMGFLELAAALKFFRTAELIHSSQPGLFTFDLVLCMWIALSILCGLYLLNLFRIGHDEPLESVSVPRLILGILFVSLGFYLLPALFTTGLEGEKQRPRGNVFAWVESFLLPDTSQGHKAGGLTWTGDLQKALDDAAAESARTGQDKFVFVDFTGESCTNCKLNEQSVFTLAEIQELFQPYIRVQMFTDKVPDIYYPTKVRSQFRGSTDRQQDDGLLNRKFQERAFNSVQLPLYVILRPTPAGPIDVVGVYSEGKINNVAAFAEFLKKPLDGKNLRAAK